MLCATVTAQRQGNIWYFGNYAGLNFNNGIPTPLTNGALDTHEGCATICDAQGVLQFYTDGISVWNRNHVTMPNGVGLMGDPSSTQSGVIVPQPGTQTPTTYYVFTVDNNAGPNGFRYSIVDMTLNGGLGDVTVKNVLLLSPTSEKVTAVRHANNRDIWVITHEWNSNRFFVYLVDSLGIQPVPVVSSVGSAHTITNANAIGYMKADPDGGKIACAIRALNRVEVFDFDDLTGVISNAISLTMPTWVNPYGVEFSPNGQFLYTTTELSKEIHQFDVSLGSQAAIQASAVLLGHYPAGAFFGALQLARDGKIYQAISGSPTLGVIRFPNKPGLACNYMYNGLNLGGPVSKYGLPTFIQSFFAAADFDHEFTCAGDSTHFFLIDTTNVDSVYWDFGDPSTGSDNFSNLIEPKHQFSSIDTFRVSLLFFGNGVFDTIWREVIIHPRAYLNFGNDTTLCTGDSLLLNAANPEATYLWHNNSTDSTFLVTGPGTYWAEVTNYCDTLTDAIVVSYAPQPTLNLGGDQDICVGDTLVLDASYLGATYLWQDSSTAATFQVTQPGTYHVRLDNGCDQLYDTVQISIHDSLIVDLGADTVLCPGADLWLYAANPNASYLWNTFASTPDYTVTSPGLYWVEVTNACETVRDSILITPQTPPTVDLGPDVTICQGDSLILDGFYPGSTFKWNTGDTTSSITVFDTDLYWVEVTNPCGFIFSFIDVQVLEPPDATLIEDTAVCPGQPVLLGLPSQTATLLWSTNSTDQNIVVNDSGTYWVVAQNLCGVDTDTVIVSHHPTPEPYLGADTALCFDEPFTLDAGIASSYLWFDGSIGQTLDPNQEGPHSVIVTNQFGCTGADTILLSLECIPVLEVPTAFTPNSDGLNDEFTVLAKYLTTYMMRVYDRWGTLIFQTPDPNVSWDGKYDSQHLPMGTYVWVANFSDVFNKTYRKQGSVTLIR